MRVVPRFIALGSAVFGGIVLSQAPELTQQYRQRIGGAIDELRVLVENFDKEASRNALDRDKALSLYATSGEPFLKDQGRTMKETINRFERLETQDQALSASSPMVQPFLLMRDADMAILRNAWRDFVPAVPVSLPGLAWSAIGFVSAYLLFRLLAFLCHGAYRLGAGRTYRLLH